MAYIKISDPKIIDLPTIHQIINVVNQHSDNISAISNNFGGIYNPTQSDGVTTQHTFDFSSQQILYGVTTVSGSDVTPSNGVYTVSVPFQGQTFSNNPIVIANYSVHSTGYTNLIVNVYSVSTDTFTLALSKVGSTSAWLAAGRNININWVALGNK
jgi:hypothetical protein